MEELTTYAPYIIIAIQVILNLKIFARSEDITKTKADLIQYVNDNFVKETVYRDNHTALDEVMRNIQQDVSDLKTMLINMNHNRYSNN